MRSNKLRNPRSETRDNRQTAIGKGAVAGLIGGLAGSWTMNQFQSLLSKLSQAKNGSRSDNQEQEAQAAEQQQSNQQQSNQQQNDDADTTQKLANKIAQTVLHRELNRKEKQIAGPVVHYGFGATVGALYGALTEAVPATHEGVGLPFGTAVWAVADEAALPVLGLSKSPQEYPVSSHVSALAAHLVYGATTELVRRTLRRIA